MVTKKAVDHIVCLVHKFFHVALPRPTEETNGEWLGTLANTGDRVTFKVEVCDFTGSLPDIRGKNNRFKVCICVIQIYHISQDG